MAGYTRNDTSNNIATGNVINAADLDGEFDALVAAFHASTGHTHDGTAANGAPITKIGPAQDLVISTGAITPKTDNTVDLGSSSFEFKDLYIDGTANIDALVADTADINAGTIDGVTLGTNSAVTEAQIDNININGNTISSTDTNGNISLVPNGTGDVILTADTIQVGDSNTDVTVTTNGTGDLIFNTNAGTNSGVIRIYDGANGNIALTPNGTGEVDISKVDIDSGAIDGTAIGANSASTGAFTTLSASSTVTLSGGTANGVLYLNGSKVLTTGSEFSYNGAVFQVGTGAATRIIDAVGASNSVSYRLRNWDAIGCDAGSGLTIGGLTGSQWTNTQFFASGSEQMRLTSTGLGIGTSSPTNPLTVGGSTRGTVLINGTNGASPYLALDNTATTNGRRYIIYSGGIGASEFNIYDATASTNRVTLSADGNLGLGVTPSAWGAGSKAIQFGAFGSISGSSGNFAGIATNRYNDGANKYIGTGLAALYEQGNGVHYWYIAPSGTAGNTISFTQAMTLDASGNLGVGATGVKKRLTVNDASSSSTTPGTNPVVWIGGGNTNVNTLSEIGFTYGSSSWAETYAPATIGYQLTSGSGYTYGALTFCTRSVTTDTAPTERARITSGGHLLVGRTSGGMDNTSGVTLWQSSIGFQSEGNAAQIYLNRTTSDGTIQEFRRNNTAVGTISVTTTATAYNTSSDYRLKDNPQPLTGSGAFIDALKPKTWNWKADNSRGVGFIAHEVQEVSPGSVVGEKDGEQMQAMEYGSAEFIANIIAELQSLRQRVALLEGN